MGTVSCTLCLRPCAKPSIFGATRNGRCLIFYRFSSHPAAVNRSMKKGLGLGDLKRYHDNPRHMIRPHNLRTCKPLGALAPLSCRSFQSMSPFRRSTTAPFDLRLDLMERPFSQPEVKCLTLQLLKAEPRHSA